MDMTSYHVGVSLQDVPPDSLQDLAALGQIALRMSTSRPEECLGDMLGWLRKTLDMDIAEVFLMEPQSGQLVLAMFQGPFQSTFATQDRFQVGQGFPGLVAQSGDPLVSEELAEDPRYLRAEVKKLGFHTYVCVPLRGSEKVIGTLQVGSRNHDLDIPRALRLLTWTGVPFGALVESMFLKARLAAAPLTPDVSTDADRGLRGHLLQLLRAMMAVGGAASGTLTLLNDGASEPVQRVTEGQVDSPFCPASQEGFLASCPALIQRRGNALSEQTRDWPDACRRLSVREGLVQCVPLIAGEHRLGMVQLRYPDGDGALRGHHLPTLLYMASGAAGIIDSAWLRDSGHPARDDESGVVALPGNGAAIRTSASEARRPSFCREDAPLLDIKCLGTFQMEHGGRLITPQVVQRRGALSFLKLLLRRPGHKFSRDALAEALWPDLDPKLGAQRLYVLIHALRQTIEPPGEGRNWLYICNEGDSYYFNTDAPFALDVQAFQRDVREGDVQEAAGRRAEAITSYESAISRYRGDYLEDEPYAEWAWEERERLREVFLATLSRLAESYSKVGAAERSIVCYQRALRADALREKTCRDLMMALWQVGRRAEALRVYETFYAALQKELGIRPMRETQDLYACIRVDNSA